MRDLTQLGVWEGSHRLTLAAHEATTTLPWEEQYGLKSQIRRSCAPVPANIAEGCGRGTNVDLARFLQSHWVLPASFGTIFSSPTTSHT